MKIYDDIPYFDGHNDVLLKLLYSKNKIKINDFIEGNENYHIDIPKINKSNFIGGFFAIFSPNEKPTEEFFSRMKANTYNYKLPEPLLYPHALSATISMISILNDIQKMPKKAQPMDVVRTVVSLMALEDKETKNNSPKANMRKAIRIFAKTPIGIAAFFRARKGKKIISPKKNLSFSENFFHMCFGKVPSKEIVKAFDVSLILYAEHSFNVSTFTARTITSSLSDIHGAITGAIASLKGPLHGGANEEVMHMMNKIKKPENALKWINNALDKKDVVMGFGHRVYKKGDSRVPTMEKYFQEVSKIKNDKKFHKIYDIVKKVMIERKDIHPNVDYPTGPTYHLMGFDTDFFTPIFVISRITGWSAHIMEQHASNKLIRPLSKYNGEKHRKVILLNQR